MLLSARVIAAFLSVLFSVAPSTAQNKPATYPALPSETPATLQPATASFDYVRREEMIAMRDGVKLHTVILVPRGAKGAPILLTRTPYSANVLTTHTQSSHLGPKIGRASCRER